MVTPRERLLAAYAHEPVDRVPCSPRLHAWLMEYYGQSTPATYLAAAQEFGFDPHYTHTAFDQVIGLVGSYSPDQLPEVNYKADEGTEGEYRVVRRRFETPAGTLADVTKFPPTGDRQYGIAPNPIRTEYLVKARDDLNALAYLIPPKDPGDLDSYFEVERLFGGKGLVMFAILSPLCHRAADALAMEDLMVLFYEDREFFDDIMDLFQREVMRDAETALAGGVRHFFYNAYYNSLSAGWSPTIWREVFAPQLKEFTKRVHADGGTVNYYDDGRCTPILEVLADTGIDVLQTLCPPPVGDVPLDEAKRRIGDRVCLMGHVDLIYVIQRGSPDLIDRTVQEAMEVGAPGGGFILGTSDSIRDGTPIENVRAYFEAARKYGQAE